VNKAVPTPHNLVSLTLVTALALSWPAQSPGQSLPATSGLPDACAIAFATPATTSEADQPVARWQSLAKANDLSVAHLERLGWAYVARARSSLDDGYYTLAEQTALCMDSRHPRSVEALLLRGHVLHQQHRFGEAEVLARELVSRRGLAVDHGLLGDVLMEQGRLGDALPSYQQMMSLRPSPEAYARAAHMRWLYGDTEGALEVMELALGAADPRAPAAAAWYAVRQGLYRWQTGEAGTAEALADQALGLAQDFPPALLLRGRLLLGENRPEEALEALTLAVAAVPLPEYRWALVDALRKAGRDQEARGEEAKLLQRGRAEDPRTLSLFLATHRQQPETALRLARHELTVRRDPHTLDALAWALFNAGNDIEARATMSQALAQGTVDPRLYLHAAVLAANADEAREWLSKLQPLTAMLLPSEQARLQELSNALTPNHDTANDSMISMTTTRNPGSTPVRPRHL
jgi:tetratricopeptide (TPR) repeat protein